MVELGMKKSYEEDYELRDWLRLFMALPLVPVELVKNAYDEILNCKPAITNKDLRSSVQRYLNYFENQWLNDNYIKIWNHFDTDGPRTNNYNEGYNNRLNKLCGSGHPNLYKFINILKREESLASIKCFRAISGYEADKRKKKDIEKDLQIETLIKEVEDDKIDLIEFVFR
jgi:hypothetical protein